MREYIRLYCVLSRESQADRFAINIQLVGLLILELHFSAGENKYSFSSVLSRK